MAETYIDTSNFNLYNYINSNTWNNLCPWENLYNHIDNFNNE